MISKKIFFAELNSKMIKVQNLLDPAILYQLTIIVK